MIDNLKEIYGAVLSTPEGIETIEEVNAELVKKLPVADIKLSLKSLTKAKVYTYDIRKNGFGISLMVRTMQGPFTVQQFMLHVGMKHYNTVVVGGKVTLKDYTHSDKLYVEELLSNFARSITDITLGYKAEL